MSKVTEVMDLRTGEYVGWWTIPPKEAVIAAYAQFEKEDYNTWLYEERYSHMLVRGRYSVACGDYAALLDTHN